MCVSVSGLFSGTPCIPHSVRLAATNKLSQKGKVKYGVKIESPVSASARFKCFSTNPRLQHSSLWGTFSKDVFWGLRSLATFLAEQPGQLKYIEWPSFQSTLKTATLTLVLVAVLIVALSSVDSALCYLLALMLRKSA